MPVGRVKWYDKTKGYGFIENPEGDVFFHFSDIQMEGFKALAEDQRVSYRLVRSPEGLKAKQVRPLDNRAVVKSAARYRTMIFMEIKPDQQEEFDRFVSHVPAWLDALQQDLGLRRIGTWRTGVHAVHLVESEKPYDQALEAVENHSRCEQFRRREGKLRELLQEDPKPLAPVMPPEEEAEQAEEG